MAAHTNPRTGGRRSRGFPTAESVEALSSARDPKTASVHLWRPHIVAHVYACASIHTPVMHILRNIHASPHKHAAKRGGHQSHSILNLWSLIPAALDDSEKG